MAIKDHVPASVAFRERYRFTRHEFHALVDAGVLSEEARVELIGGDLAVMSPINPRQASVVDRLTSVFSRTVAGRAIVRVQNPLVIADDTELQPDLSLLKPRPDFYAGDHPLAGDVLLAVEVADSSLRHDQEVKAPLCALAGVAEMWVLNLPDNLLEVYRDPSPKGYRSLRRLSTGDNVSPLAFPDLTLAVADLLPPES